MDLHSVFAMYLELHPQTNDKYHAAVYDANPRGFSHGGLAFH